MITSLDRFYSYVRQQLNWFWIWTDMYFVRIEQKVQKRSSPRFSWNAKKVTLRPVSDTFTTTIEKVKDSESSFYTIDDDGSITI